MLSFATLYEHATTRGLDLNSDTRLRDVLTSGL